MVNRVAKHPEYDAKVFIQKTNAKRFKGARYGTIFLFKKQ